MKRKPCWKKAGRQCAIWRWHKSPNWLGLKNFKTIKSRRSYTRPHMYRSVCVCMCVCLFKSFAYNTNIMSGCCPRHGVLINKNACVQTYKQTKWLRRLEKNFDGTKSQEPRERAWQISSFRFSWRLFVGSHVLTRTDKHTLVYYNRNKTGTTKCQQLLIHNGKCDKWKSYGLPMLCISEPSTNTTRHTQTHSHPDAWHIVFILSRVPGQFHTLQLTACSHSSGWGCGSGLQLQLGLLIKTFA